MGIMVYSLLWVMQDIYIYISAAVELNPLPQSHRDELQQEGLGVHLGLHKTEEV